jgi:hypothetical protein
MARGAAKRLSAWDAAVLELQGRGTRYRLRRVSASPFIYVMDLRPAPGGRVEWSLKPLRREEDADIARAVQWILAAGEDPWPAPGRGTSADGLPGWSLIAEQCRSEWASRMKASSASHYLSALGDLGRQDVPRSRKGLRAWALQKAPGSRSFLTRIEVLSQIRKGLRAGAEATPPAWLPGELLDELRDLHKARRPRQQGEVNGIRGIPTEQEGRSYLDALAREHPLEQWCLAMQFCYGLRNHELWWCSPITEAAGDVLPGWLLVPGRWRTKSKEEHWVWPLFPDWIDRYQLRARLQECQQELHRRKKPALVSVRDQSRPWREGDPGDPGLCVNNHYLGSFITRQMREVLPEWRARVPDTGGHYRETDRPAPITPYDLRHAWAVIVATDPRWRHVRDEDAARAMGHDLEVHRRRYQRWIGAEERRRRAMGALRTPPAMAQEA